MPKVVFIGYVYSQESGYIDWSAEIPVIFMDSVEIDPNMMVQEDGWENDSYEYHIDGIREIEDAFEYARNSEEGAYIVQDGKVGFSRGEPVVEWSEDFPNSMVRKIAMSN